MKPERMIDLSQLDELARRLSNLVPPGLREGREELQQNFKSVLQAGLGKLDLVTREEFDVQRAVLLRTRWCSGGAPSAILPLAVPSVRPATVASICLLYTSPSPRDRTRSRMPSSA